VSDCPEHGFDKFIPIPNSLEPLHAINFWVESLVIRARIWEELEDLEWVLPYLKAQYSRITNISLHVRFDLRLCDDGDDAACERKERMRVFVCWSVCWIEKWEKVFIMPS
jgi:hypothetical protein